MQSQPFWIFFVFVILLSTLVSVIFIYQLRKYGVSSKTIKHVEEVYVLVWLILVAVSVVALSGFHI